MSYPSTIDAPDTTMQGGSFVATNDHAQDHRLLGSALIQIENKLGIGSGSAAANQVLVGSGVGTAQWGSVWNNATLGTPTIGTSLITGGTLAGQIQNNGTVANGVYGTALHQGGTVANAVIGTPTVNGVLYPTAAPSAGQVPMATNAGTATWQAPMFFATSGTQADTSTTSSSFVGVAGGTVTFTPPRAVTVMAWASGDFYDATGTANDCTFALLVNGTIIQQIAYRPSTTNFRNAIALAGQSPMGAALGTVSVQYKVAGGDTLHADQINVSVIYG